MKQSHRLSVFLAAAAIGAVSIPAADGFAVPSTHQSRSRLPSCTANTNCRSSSTHLFSSTENLSLQLSKPLGLILEEDESGSGVIVTQVNEGGSAYENPSASKLVGSKIQSVSGSDVSSASFDDVMAAIIEADSPLDVVFAVKGSVVQEEAVSAAVAEPEEEKGYKIGTEVKITVQQPQTNKPDIILNAKVGENLRKTLLANNEIELYRGLKKKLGNCGGGGQCGFCAVELIDEEGCWGERSEYEENKIGKKESERCRLACLNNIAGPAIVRTL